MRAGTRLLLACGIVAAVLALGLATAQAPSCAPDGCVYLPLVERAAPTLTPSATATSTAIPPTSTPTLPPPSYNNCQEDPNPGAAPGYPVRIVTVFKAAVPEVVRLQNVSTSSVDLSGWHMCSITGNQLHDGVGGVLGPGETRDYAYTGACCIWNNTLRDDGALYTPDGRLASYWIDQ